MQKSKPRKKAALSKHGVICSPSTRKNNECRKKLVKHFKEVMQQKRSMKVQYLHAMKKYNMLRTTSLLFDMQPSEIVRVRDVDTPRGKRNDSLSNDVKEKVNHHYNQQSVSTTLPDKKSVKHGQEWKVLDRPLKDVYHEFKEDHPEVKVGFSTFAANKPSNIHTSRKQQWYSCLCEACTNVDLKLRALNNFATKVRKPEQKVQHRYEAVKITLCTNEEC